MSLSKDIPAGYQLHISSYENDADYRMTEICSGIETKEDVQFYIDLVCEFRSGYQGGFGNQETTDEQLEQAVGRTLANNPHISSKLRNDWKQKDDDKECWHDGLRDGINNLLGYSVADQNYTFCREFAGVEVFFIPATTSNVTKEFNIR